MAESDCGLVIFVAGTTRSCVSRSFSPSPFSSVMFSWWSSGRSIAEPAEKTSSHTHNCEKTTLTKITDPTDDSDGVVAEQLATVRLALFRHRVNKAALKLMDDELSQKLYETVVKHGKRKMLEALEDVYETLADNDLTLPSCPVCKMPLTSEISTFGGCTHGACHTCMERMKDGVCPVCRKHSRSIKKLRFV